MLVEPGVSHDDILAPQVCDSEEGAFRVVLISQDEVSHFRYSTGFVKCAIYIAYAEGLDNARVASLLALT